MATILLVDDEPSVLKLCQLLLRRGGYEVISAVGGADALRTLKSNHASGIDLALLDVMMPMMNGIELANKLRETNPNIVIVLMSGFSPREILPIVGDHPYRIIWKPFKSESLLQMLENALDNALGASA